jgi:hypothetical protein
VVWCGDREQAVAGAVAVAKMREGGNEVQVSDRGARERGEEEKWEIYQMQARGRLISLSLSMDDEDDG